MAGLRHEGTSRHLTGMNPTVEGRSRQGWRSRRLRADASPRRYQMPVNPLRRSLVVVVLVVAAALGGATAANASAAQPFCGITWGSLAKGDDTMSPAALVDVRTGQHPCYDRVVFDFRGRATGYHVNYGSAVSQGKGDVLSVAGGAVLDVVLLANDYDVETGVRTYPHGVGAHVADVAGYRTLRDVVYGGSFEGYTTFGVGVRARLPFRVFTLAGPGTGSRIVIDVAHRWS
jgi:hypothetical protein